MSADNVILVVHRTRSLDKGEHWIVQDYVSFYPENKAQFEKVILRDLLDRKAKDFPTREEALTAAHDLLRDDPIVEYGVREIDLDTLTDEYFDPENGTHVAFI